jgi:PIN domain nuclease of toxin-antitoxin system
MKILIDTQIFLWIQTNPEKLSTSQMSALQNPHNQIYVSAISLTEIIIKVSIGKLNFAADPLAIAKQSGLNLLDYRAEDTVFLQTLPLHHKDPFDRMLIAQAKANDMLMMTNDSLFKLYDCELN